MVSRALTILVAAGLTACAPGRVDWTPGTDRNGLTIPGSIEGVSAVVHVMDRQSLVDTYAGTEWNSWRTNALHGFYRIVDGTCHVYLASDALDALEHEMAHCKYGRWHGGAEETLRLLRQAKQ